MSAVFDTAEKIATLLHEGTGIPFIIDRQKDIKTEVKRIGLQAKGGLIIVSYVGGSREDEDAAARFMESFIVTYWTKPIINKDDTPADDVVEKICQLLDWHTPPGTNFNNRWIVTGKLRFDDPDTSLLVHRITLKIRLLQPSNPC